MKKNTLLLKNMSFVTIGTLISRLLGYFRDMLVATVFGAGYFADAFYAAFRIPNLFRRLFGESSLNAAFVPVLSEYLGIKPKYETEEFLSAVATVLFVILGIVTVLGIIFAYPITKIITWGFPQEKLVLTSRLLQIMFPFMWLICLSALGLSILNCLKIFFIPAASSASLSIAEILFILFLVYRLPVQKQIEGLAISVLVGGMLQLSINYYLVRKNQYKITVSIKKFFNFLTFPSVKKIMVLFVPVVIGFSIDQINALVDTLCASFLKEGSVSALYYSNRLMQLPLALFGTAIVTVALPQMAQEFVVGTQKDIVETIVHSVRNVIYFLLPASVGLAVLGKPIIKTLFERGSFTNESTLMTYSCLLYYSLGITFFSISKIFISTFYAMKKTYIPVKVAGVCVIINLVLNIILMQYLEVGGLALSTTITSLISCWLLYKNLKLNIEIKIFDIETKKFLLKIFLTNFVLFLTVLLVKTYFSNFIVITFTGIILGTTVYFITSKILKIEETSLFLNWLNKYLPFKQF